MELKFTNFLSSPLKKNNVKLLFTYILVIDTLGSGAYIGTSVLFLINFLHMNPSVIALILLWGGVLAFISLFGIGIAVDYIGPGTWLIGANFFRAILLPLLLCHPNFWGILLITVVVTILDRSSIPIIQSIITDIEPDEPTAYMAQTRTIQNIGFVFGSLIAAIISLFGTIGLAISVIFNSVSFLIAGILLLVGKLHKLGKNNFDRKTLKLIKSFPFLSLSAAIGFAGIHANILNFAIPAIISHKHFPFYLSPLCVAINSIVVMLFQIKVTQLMTKKIPINLGFFISFTALFGCGISAILTDQYGKIYFLVSLLIIQTIAELFQQSLIWDLGYTLAHGQAKSTILATFNIGSTARQFYAPSLLNKSFGLGDPSGFVLYFLLLGLGYFTCLASYKNYLLKKQSYITTSDCTTH